MGAVDADGEREARAAEEALALRAQIKTCVHDLRNALAAQTSAVHLLAKTAGDPAHAAALGRGLLEQCGRLNDVIDRLASIADAGAQTGGNETHTAANTVHAEHDASLAAAIGRGRRVLVVDDNVDAALTLAAVLRFEGHEVITAHDGMEALRNVQTSRPDIVVLDIEMPLMNGYEAATRIRHEYSSNRKSVV